MQWVRTFESRARPMRAAILPALLLATASPARAHADARSAPLCLQVANTLDLERRDEVLELPLRAIWARRPGWRGRALAAYAETDAQALPSQLYATDGGSRPDRLLVLLDLAPRASLSLRIVPAGIGTTEFPRRLYARRVPERDDDFAWENLRVAYRIYGAALQARDGAAPGIDVWSKRPSRLVVDDWYRRDAEGLRRHDPELSYHVDRGDGPDAYAVGRSPGAGGTAAWIDGAPVQSGNARRVRITAMGPVRLRFEVDYAPWRAGDVRVHEHKAVTLDAGAHLNRQRVRYAFDGAAKMTMAAGLAVHRGARVRDLDGHGLAVWDTPQKAGPGRIATGLDGLAGEPVRMRSTAGARWVLFDVADGGTIEFVSGAGWSHGDVADFAAWLRLLRDDRMRRAHPLQVRWGSPPVRSPTGDAGATTGRTPTAPAPWRAGSAPHSRPWP